MSGGRSLRALVLGAVALGVLARPGWAAPASPHSAFAPAGPQAELIHALGSLLFWVCTGVYVIVMVALVVAARRRGSAQDDFQPVADAEQQRLGRVVLGAVAVTATILFVFLLAALRTDRALMRQEDGPGVVTVRVTGRQWWWDLTYEDSDPTRRFSTANELHIPVGRPVQLKLQTADVIHSLWVPSLQGKKDLIPGRENELWLRADRAGEYMGQCAEFCGLQHAHMGLLVIAETPEQYEAWRARQLQPSAEPGSEDLKKGRGVFLGSTCVVCHAIRGTTAGSRVGPDLTHFGGRRMLGAATVPNNRGHLAGWILDPQGIKPGTQMPAHALDSTQLRALLDYLESLQ